MTDLEITRLCAEAMGMLIGEWIAPARGLPPTLRAMPEGQLHEIEYDPLHDDAQAMGLVKKLHLHIGKTLRTPDNPHGTWVVSRTSKYDGTNMDLNRAICECAAKVQVAKVTA